MYQFVLAVLFVIKKTVFCYYRPISASSLFLTFCLYSLLWLRNNNKFIDSDPGGRF